MKKSRVTFITRDYGILVANQGLEPRTQGL